jgi:hypothetical protein
VSCHHAAPGASPPLRAVPEEAGSRRCDPLRGASLLCVGARGVGLEHTGLDVLTPAPLPRLARRRQ